MNKILQIGSILMLSVTLPSYAALILNGTRFIYEEGTSRKEVTITNNSDSKMGAQIWIEPYDNINDARGYTGKNHFTASPSLIKIKPKKKAQINIVNIVDNLPTDHESIYWLNIQEIPQKADIDAPAVIFAQRIKVKLIYRPKGLGERYLAEESQSITCTNRNIIFNNSTGFIFSPLSYSIDGVRHIFTNVLIPHENTLDRGGSSCPKTISIEYINDFGGIKTHEFNVSK